MKVTLDFGDNEERDARAAVRWRDYWLCLARLREELRSRRKHGASESKTWEDAEALFLSLLGEYDITLAELQ